MDRLLNELRYSVRCLLKQPSFSLVAFITLALGIGANAAIFSVINALIITPPRFSNPDRVVALWQTPADKRIEGFVSYLDYKDWRTRNHSFEDIAAYKPTSITVSENGESEILQGMRVSANFFPLLKTFPIKGRQFNEDEEKPTPAPSVVLSYDYWQTHFGGSNEALGQKLILNGTPHEVIGVLPADFQFPFSTKDAAVWTTVAGENSNLKERGARVLRVVGRLKASVSIDQAQADIKSITAELSRQYPRTDIDSTAYVVGAHEQIVGRDVRYALWLLFGVVAFILLISCTNTANLLLVRAGARQREVALRAALGAGRWQIARELISESLLLSLVSGLGGVLLAIWGLKAIKYYADGQLPRLDEVTLNTPVLLFTLVLSVITGVLFSLLPALKSSNVDVNEVLKSTSKSATSSRTLHRWRDSLVIIEVALSLILLVGAGLMIKSFAQLVNVPPGFDPTNVLTARISMTSPTYKKTEPRVEYVDQTLAKLKSLPGVENAAFVAPMPFSGGNVGGDFRIKGQPEPQPGQEPDASVRSVTTQYFQAIRIPLIAGRYFSDADRRGGVGAAIVNEALVQRYFASGNPVGQFITNIGANQNEGDPVEWQIVGVVGDVHHSSLLKAAQPEIYLPFQQNSWNWGNFFVRVNSQPKTLTAAFRQEIKAQDKTVSVTDVRVLSDAIAETVTKPRFFTLLFALFGALGLILTMTGVYGVISYAVSQRTQEIGIRMALGATRQNVVQLILRHGLALTIAGAVLGLGVSLALSRLIASLLFEVKPTDLMTFGIATLVMIVAALLASFLPARRATKVDPLVALRYE